MTEATFTKLRTSAAFIGKILNIAAVVVVVFCKRPLSCQVTNTSNDFQSKHIKSV